MTRKASDPGKVAADDVVRGTAGEVIPVDSACLFENGVGATMKLTTTTVKVCSTELNDSRSKDSVTDAGREASPESTTEVRTVQPQ